MADRYCSYRQLEPFYRCSRWLLFCFLTFAADKSLYVLLSCWLWGSTRPGHTDVPKFGAADNPVAW